MAPVVVRLETISKYKSIKVTWLNISLNGTANMTGSNTYEAARKRTGLIGAILELPFLILNPSITANSRKRTEE